MPARGPTGEVGLTVCAIRSDRRVEEVAKHRFQVEFLAAVHVSDVRANNPAIRCTLVGPCADPVGGGYESVKVSWVEDAASFELSGCRVGPAERDKLGVEPAGYHGPDEIAPPTTFPKVHVATLLVAVTRRKYRFG